MAWAAVTSRKARPGAWGPLSVTRKEGGKEGSVEGETPGTLKGDSQPNRFSVLLSEQARVPGEPTLGQAWGKHPFEQRGEGWVQASGLDRALLAALPKPLL